MVEGTGRVVGEVKEEEEKGEEGEDGSLDGAHVREPHGEDGDGLEGVRGDGVGEGAEVRLLCVDVGLLRCLCLCL